jgi:hypothetical protein
MRAERIELSQRERERLKVFHEVQQHEAAEWLGLRTRQVRRLLGRIRREGDRSLIHRLRGKRSNRRFAGEFDEMTIDLVRAGMRISVQHLPASVWLPGSVGPSLLTSRGLDTDCNSLFRRSR